ncbi:BTAD domain-containing putative transcriptional regulator [Nocardia sp. NPDC004123]
MRAAVELERNRLGEVAVELRTVFDAHPEREEITRQLATAQYRAGQQAHAPPALAHSRVYPSVAEYSIGPSRARWARPRGPRPTTPPGPTGQSTPTGARSGPAQAGSGTSSIVDAGDPRGRQVVGKDRCAENFIIEAERVQQRG